MLLLVLAFIAADSKARFIADYPSEVRELKREFAEARGVATLHTVKDGKPGPPAVFRFATGPGRRKFEYESTFRRPAGKTSFHGLGYAELDGRNIEVQRNGPSAPYTVRGIGDDDPMRRMVFNALFGNYLNAPWGFGGFDFGDALARGWFAVTEAREVEVDGRGLVEVTFRLTTTAQPHYYWAAFDPRLHWAIMRASAWEADPSKPTERYEATYGPTASGRTYMKTLHWWDLNGKEKLSEFGPIEFAPTPAAEFTLEHYGLKSPPLPYRRPNYLILIAILTLAVALLLAAWLLRRRATRLA